MRRGRDEQEVEPPSPAADGTIAYIGSAGGGDDVAEASPANDPDGSDDGPVRRFCRILPAARKTPDPDALIDLGMLMEVDDEAEGGVGDSRTPAGYTYLGQFIDHDMTFDRDTPLTTGPAVQPEAIFNFRSPELDLDSVYGGGPDRSPELFEADGRLMKVGMTAPADGIETLPNDLPRRAGTIDALIGDPRNDENLAVAQTHLAFLKFHNARARANPGASFGEIRNEVVRSYQAIVLGDFLPRVVDPLILIDVMENGRQFFGNDDLDSMPIEFAAAAYRMGHSMIRPTYEWNRIFSSNGPRGAATLEQLFEFSGVSGSTGGDPPFLGLPALPSNWVVDWRRF